MYSRVGGGAAVARVIDDFYEQVLVDGELAPYFQGVDMTGQRRHLAAMVSQVMGGPREYSGRELSDAHAHLGVTDAAFDKVAGYLVDALSSNGVPQDIIDQLAATVLSLRDQVVSVPAGPRDGGAAAQNG